MRFFRNNLFLSAVLAVACAFATPAVQAQQAQKPVAIVSFTPLEKLLKDSTYILRACNVPEFGGIFNMMATTYTQGLDPKRPIGVSVTLDGQNPVGLVFVPVSDRSRFFAALETMGIEPDDLGDGLFEIDANGQTIFAKESNGWLFIAQAEDSLNSLPQNPATLLGDLPNKYDIAVRLNVQALPADLKDMAVQQMRIGLENTLNEQGGLSDQEREDAARASEAQIAQLESFISDTEQVILGWSIDSVGQKTFFDAAAQFMEGTKFANQANAMKDLKSAYSAFQLPGTSASFRATSTYNDEADKEMAKQNLKNSMVQIRKQIDDANTSEDSKELVRNLAEALLELTEKTIDEGTFDGAGSLSVADDTLRVLFGGRIADGRALEGELKKLVAGLPNSSEKPDVKFDYETFQGVTLHSIALPVKIADPNARKIFGDELKIWVGTADKAFMVSMDPTGDGSLKAAIEAMQAAPNAPATPFEGVIEFTDLLKFAQAVSPNPILDNVLQTIQEFDGKDKVEVIGSIIPRGGIYRLSIDEGVLRAAGTAAKMGSGGGGGF
ncbi:MAG: hypothetical protein R3C53_11285 [Pirellulaceae bacterium]